MTGSGVGDSRRRCTTPSRSRPALAGGALRGARRGILLKEGVGLKGQPVELGGRGRDVGVRRREVAQLGDLGHRVSLMTQVISD